MKILSGWKVSLHYIESIIHSGGKSPFAGKLASQSCMMVLPFHPFKLFQSVSQNKVSRKRLKKSKKQSQLKILPQSVSSYIKAIIEQQWLLTLGTLDFPCFTTTHSKTLTGRRRSIGRLTAFVPKVTGHKSVERWKWGPSRLYGIFE